jgi:hypothetical protein
MDQRSKIIRKNYCMCLTLLVPVIRMHCYMCFNFFTVSYLYAKWRILIFFFDFCTTKTHNYKNTHPLAKLCRPTESASLDLSIDVHNLCQRMSKSKTRSYPRVHAFCSLIFSYL